MGIRSSVFGSSQEQAAFKKLSRAWGDKYRIYHNLPFLNVCTFNDLIDADKAFKALSDTTITSIDITLNDVEKSRLKKTSIDFVLCDDSDRPLLAIDFDGLCEGFNVGVEYHATLEPSPWRQEITELKLRVAHGSGLPYFVVASKHFADITEDIRLTVVDGIIGEVLSKEAFRQRTVKGFDPMEYGMTQEAFDALQPGLQHEYFQDFMLQAEVTAEFEHSPITRRYSELLTEIPDMRYRSRPLTPPQLRGKKECARIGIEVTVQSPSHPTVPPVVEVTWIPNFQTVGLSEFGLLEKVALIVAATRLKNRLPKIN